jgi:uracil phosphoribosyltransferase
MPDAPWTAHAPVTFDVPPPQLHISQHPLVRHKLAHLREVGTEPKKFRELVRELTWLLGYEALADVHLEPLTVTTPLEQIPGEALGDRIGLIPILRAGLGMVDAMLELLPMAEVWHLGLFRDEHTLRPVEYYNKLPDSRTVDVCLILDPMLATGGSAQMALEGLGGLGALHVRLLSIVSAPEGVAHLSLVAPDAIVFTAALDRGLNDRKYILPGLGDFGDRLFGT